jgi:Flavin reductase like domain
MCMMTTTATIPITSNAMSATPPPPPPRSSSSSITPTTGLFQKTPPPPAISMPVWSLACSTKALSITASSSSPQLQQQPQLLPSTSMNIVTFCTQVSVAAPKLYIISLYYNTLTKDAFLASGSGLLQLLRPEQKRLVTILGRQSGYHNLDTATGNKKRLECATIGYPWVPSNIATHNHHHRHDDDDDDDGNRRTRPCDATTTTTCDALPNCAMYLHVKIVHDDSSTESAGQPAGDHLVVLCQVLETYQWDETTQQIVPIASTSNHVIPSLDASTVLYTGQLRQEGII